ncbi:MAG: CheR family methyltransferase [Polyangiaceae bacterium]
MSTGVNEQVMDDAASAPRRPALIVAVGASAGGLEAVQRMLENAQPGAGLAYVVILHLDPERPSLIAEIFGRHTRLRVREAEDGARIRPDEVWVNTPNTTLAIHDGALHVASPADPHRRPIDIAFRSLAADQGERCAAAVLSGTGDDGTVGLRAIREHGGFTLAQSPSTAAHPGMPRSAISAAVVDEVLPPEAMPKWLSARAQGIELPPPPVEPPAPRAPQAGDDLAASLPRICEILKKSTGNDFSGYKQGTLLRRLRRRLQLQGVASASEYIEALEAEASPEPGLLVSDLLIAVTKFFRDKTAFEALSSQILPAIASTASEVHPVRVWVPGCASGEEVYSIAILLAEQIRSVGRRIAVQIFATDIDAGALQTARAGRYSEAIAEDVSPARLQRFFVHQHGAYHVAKELREMCVFSVHNLLRDPPFSQIDLVSCRNVLIYFDAALQRRVMPLFHYALRRGGYLFLGPSEDAASQGEMFVPIDKVHRIFQRREMVGRMSFDFQIQHRPAPPRVHHVASELGSRSAKQAVTVAFERTILEEYAPACALVDDRAEILAVAGPFSRYLSPRAGVYTGNILDHAEGVLRHALRTALADSMESSQAVTVPRVVVSASGAVQHLRLTVRPAPGGGAAAGLRMLVLEEHAPDTALTADLQDLSAHEPLIAQLESELTTTRADLQAAVSELESTNQELKSSNEELMSTNEELQSANEELQTSKEELQSVNEELETVNAELRAMVKELGVTNSDLQNLLASTSVATIFLNRELSVTRFTPAATSLFSLIDTDVGRPLADLVPRFAGTDLIADVKGVLASLIPIEKEVHTDDAWFMLRVLPYRTVDDVIAGAVATFTDVTRIKRAEAAVRESEHLLKDILDASPLLIFLKDMSGRFVKVNRQFLAHTGKRMEEVIGKTSFDVFPPDRAQRYMEHDQRVLDCGDVVVLEDLATLPDGEHTFLAYRFPLHDADGNIYGVSGILQDITERNRWERASREAERRSREMLDSMPQLVWTCAPDGTRDFVSRQWIDYTGVPAERNLGLGWLETVHPDDRAAVMEAWKQGVSSGDTIDLKLRLQSAEGAYRWFRSRAVPLRDDESRVVKWIGTSTDIHDLVTAEEVSQEANRRKSEFLALLSHELRNPLAPIRTSLQILARVDAGSDQASRALDVIRRQIEQLSRLVDDLLDITRISENRIRLQRERADLCAIARRTTDDHRTIFERAGVELRLSLPPSPVLVMVDPARIAQVVGNLLQNAVKFSREGGKTEVSVRSGPGFGPCGSSPSALLSVTDDGIGMARETVERLFQPFVQADVSLDRNKGGLGLGLSLVRRLVDLHGGAVRARSEGLGQGSELEVCLPLAEPAPEPEAPPEPGPLPARAAAS